MGQNKWVRRILWIILILGITAGLVWMGLQRDKVSHTEPSANPSFSTEAVIPLPKEQRPAMEAISFQDAQGKSLTPASFAGQVVLINLWATWCPPCVAEMPDLDVLQQRWAAKNVKVIAISVDAGGINRARSWLNKQGLHALIPYSGGNEIVVTGQLPTSFLLDKQGRIAWMGVGMQDWTGPETRAALEGLLSEAFQPH